MSIFRALICATYTLCGAVIVVSGSCAVVVVSLGWRMSVYPLMKNWKPPRAEETLVTSLLGGKPPALNCRTGEGSSPWRSIENPAARRAATRHTRRPSSLI